MLRKAEESEQRFHLGILFALIPGTVLLISLPFFDSFEVLAVRYFALSDDATISLTYARTLVESGEFVWFPDAQRVQGVTNPLWTLFLTIPALAGMEDQHADLLVSLLASSSVLLSVFFSGLIVKRLTGNDSLASMSGWIAAFTIPFIYPLTLYATRGLEVPLLAFLLAFMVWLVIAGCGPKPNGSLDRWRLIPLFGVASAGVITRLDFLIFVPLFGVFIWIASTNNRQAMSRVAMLFGVVGVSSIAFLCWQYAYYGDPLPNTYYLKVDGFGFEDRLPWGLVTTGKVIPLAALVVVARVWALLYARRTGRKTYVEGLLTAIFFAAISYSLWAGGDAWDVAPLLNRFIAVVLPCVAILTLAGLGSLLRLSNLQSVRKQVWLITLIPASIALSFGIEQMPQLQLIVNVSSQVNVYFLVGTSLLSFTFVAWLLLPIRRSLRCALSLMTLSLLLVTLTSHGMWVYFISNGKTAFATQDEEVTRSSLALASVLSRDAIIATAHAGAPAYFTYRPMVDILGKNDEYIARTQPKGLLLPGHNKWDYTHSIGSLRPDVIRQTWVMNAADEQNFRKWGYEEFCWGDYNSQFRLISKEVEWSRLKSCN